MHVGIHLSVASSFPVWSPNQDEYYKQWPVIRFSHVEGEGGHNPPLSPPPPPPPPDPPPPPPLCLPSRACLQAVDLFNKDNIHGKAPKSVSFVLNKFSQIANIESKLITYWHIGLNNLEMNSVPRVSQEGRLLPQCISANDVFIKRVQI